MVTKRGRANGDEIILFLDGVGIGTPPVRCHLIEVGAQLGGVESHQEVEKSVEAVSRLAAGKREQWQTRLVEDVALLVENGVCVRVETKRGGMEVFCGVSEIGASSFFGMNLVSNMLRMKSRVNSRPMSKREMRSRARFVMTTDERHDQ